MRRILPRMPMTVDFSNEVRDWIAQNLRGGCQPQAIAQQLMEHKVAPELAVAMVEAVSSALTFGTPMPEGKLTLGAPRPDYIADPGRLPAGPLVKAGNRMIRVLSRMQRPTGALLGNVLDINECERLIALAKPRLNRSTVVDPITGLDRVVDHRSSEGMFFGLMESPLIERLDRRIADLMGLPVENGEGIQILHYPTGAESTPHFDFLIPSNNANRESIARSGQRVSTLIIYLNDVPAGGETTFDQLGLSIVPQRGQAIYFEYGNHLGQTDPLSLHAGAPVLAGDKWIATKWMRERTFVPAGGSAPR